MVEPMAIEDHAGGRRSKSNDGGGTEDEDDSAVVVRRRGRGIPKACLSRSRKGSPGVFRGCPRRGRNYEKSPRGGASGVKNEEVLSGRALLATTTVVPMAVFQNAVSSEEERRTTVCYDNSALAFVDWTSGTTSGRPKV